MVKVKNLYAWSFKETHICTHKFKSTMSSLYKPHLPCRSLCFISICWLYLMFLLTTSHLILIVTHIQDLHLHCTLDQTMQSRPTDQKVSTVSPEKNHVIAVGVHLSSHHSLLFQLHMNHVDRGISVNIFTYLIHTRYFHICMRPETDSRILESTWFFPAYTS